MVYMAYQGHKCFMWQKKQAMVRIKDRALEESIKEMGKVA
jgi:hypothetical protein